MTIMTLELLSGLGYTLYSVPILLDYEREITDT